MRLGVSCLIALSCVVVAEDARAGWWSRRLACPIPPVEAVRPPYAAPCVEPATEAYSSVVTSPVPYAMPITPRYAQSAPVVMRTAPLLQSPTLAFAPPATTYAALPPTLTFVPSSASGVTGSSGSVDVRPTGDVLQQFLGAILSHASANGRGNVTGSSGGLNPVEPATPLSIGQGGGPTIVISGEGNHVYVGGGFPPFVTPMSFDANVTSSSGLVTGSSGQVADAEQATKRLDELVKMRESIEKYRTEIDALIADLQARQARIEADAAQGESANSVDAPGSSGEVVNPAQD